mgnify:CR=1 FL=1
MNTMMTSHSWNYLRVRGEYFAILILPNHRTELPPRARRILERRRSNPCSPGTTSACAENTRRIRRLPLPHRNYLRVRGEYRSASLRNGFHRELPPRARRIHCLPPHPLIVVGTTSACAENTWNHRIRPTQSRNYLRVRGEYVP